MSFLYLTNYLLLRNNILDKESMNDEFELCVVIEFPSELLVAGFENKTQRNNQYSSYCAVKGRLNTFVDDLITTQSFFV